MCYTLAKLLFSSFCMEHKKFVPVGQGLHFGWKEFHTHTSFYISAGLILLGFFIAFSVLGDVFEDAPIAAFAIFIAYVIVMSLLTIGYIKEVLLAVRGKQPSYKRLFSYSNTLIPYILCELAYKLIVFAGIILFIVPGIIWAIKYMFAPYLVLDKGLTVKEALKESKRITKGIKWDLLGAGIPIAIAGYLGIFALGIGLFVSLQISAIAMAFIYVSVVSQGTIKRTTEKKLLKKRSTKK